MEANELWLWLVPVALLPVFFAMGWFAARVDMKAVLKQAKSIPGGFYTALDALVDKHSGRAADNLAEVIAARADDAETRRLSLTLGKLYRQRGQNDKAIVLHQKLLASPDTVGIEQAQTRFELGQDYQAAGLVDRAEQIFLELQHSEMAPAAQQMLLNIYQQDRDWEKAIELAQVLRHGDQSYQFEIAQFYCERAQTALFQSRPEEAESLARQALTVNRKCTRANLILADAAYKQGRYQDAIDACHAIEKQNHEYLSMAAERLYDAHDALGQAEAGLAVLVGYAKTFPDLDLHNVIYEKSLLLKGEAQAAQTVTELVRQKPDLAGVYRLLGAHIGDTDPARRADMDMMRAVVGRQMQKAVMYRCRHCHFKSQAYFWHCPACNKWETFTPNRVEV